MFTITGIGMLYNQESLHSVRFFILSLDFVSHNPARE